MRINRRDAIKLLAAVCVRDGWPDQRALIGPLATNGKHVKGKIRNVELLGHQGKLEWTQDESGLKIQLPFEAPGAHAFAFKVEGLDLG
jgi:alpha-L-fucosidase